MFLLAVFSLFLVSCATGSSIKNSGGDYTDFVNCLTEKGVKMYGASWCTHCKAQKSMFGAAYKNLNYTECSVGDTSTSGQTKVCKDAGIRGYPTWTFADGYKIEGEAELTELSSKSGCSLDLIKFN